MNAIRFYKVHSAWPASEATLSEMLAVQAFKPCNAFSEKSFGFEKPVDEVSSFARRLNGADLVQMRIQTRVLPGGAVKEALTVRVDEFVSRTQQAPSRREKRELKEEVYGELLPKALTSSEHIRAFYLSDDQILAIGNASEAKAEQMLSILREAFGSLQVTPLAFNKPVEPLLREVLIKGSSDPLIVGRECSLKDYDCAAVKCSEFDLPDTNLKNHLDAGLKVAALAMRTITMSFTLDVDCVMRKIKTAGLEAVDEMEGEDELSRHDAEFIILSSAICEVLRILERKLGKAA